MRNQLHVQLDKLEDGEMESKSVTLPRLKLSHGTAKPQGVKIRETSFLYKPQNHGYR